MHKLKTYFLLARPHQYIKNGFVWLPLFFGYKLQDPHAFLHTAYAFLAFCLVSSSVYVFNDITDIEDDLQHPKKKFRPLARGALGKLEAMIFCLVLLFLSFSVSFIFLPIEVPAILGGYMLLNFAYSVILKHFAVIDVVCIAVGFILRIYAGGIASDVHISRWLVIMTFLIALFLALAKRREDLILAGFGHNARKGLDGYNLDFVSLSMVITASVTIVSYILYTVSPEITEKHGTNQLYLTGFWVILGFFRYLQITFVEQPSGAPTSILLKDSFLQVTIILWLLNIYLLLYAFSP